MTKKKNLKKHLSDLPEKVKVDIVWDESGHCDDCGSFESCTLKVYEIMPHGTPFLLKSYRYNDHLGGEFDIHDSKQVLEKVFQALNIPLEIEEIFPNVNVDQGET